jgi:hypothetical protein
LVRAAGLALEVEAVLVGLAVVAELLEAPTRCQWLT